MLYACNLDFLAAPDFDRKEGLEEYSKFHGKGTALDDICT
jgi:hypothetical protein